MPEELFQELDPEVQMLNNNEQDGYNYRLRRHEDWLENYTLSRDKVIVNRITQRQSVNLPLMKTTFKTLIKDVDDMPVMYFKNLDNDKQAEVFKNEYWKYTGVENKFEIQDIIDKRQMFHFGRTYDQWQIIDGKVVMSIVDPMDILISRYNDPTNIHASRFLIHLHIFKPLSQLENNPGMYDPEKVSKLKKFYATEMGLVKAEDNLSKLIEKNKKMEEMGVQDVQSPVLGETYVELALHFVMRDVEEWEGQTYKNQIFLYVVADKQEILRKVPLEKVIGETTDHFWQNHYPYNSWADDVERQDWYSDGVADIIRTPNKIVNAWFSQLVENRTLKNLNMNIFNSKIEGFSPQTWTPQAWGMYGIPLEAGQKLTDVFQQLPVADLTESLDEMTFLITMIEKASGATATQQGAQTERKITLGEVQLALGEAKERIKGMSKFYTQVWKERGLMFTKLIEAAPDKLDAVEIHKKGRNTDKIYTREIEPKDWMTKSGYYCEIWDQDEKNETDMQNLEKISAVSQMIPGNPKLEEIKQRKALEFAGLKPEEVTDVLEVERMKREAMMSMGGIDPVTGQPLAPTMPMAQAPVASVAQGAPVI